MAGFVPGLLPTNHSQEMEFAQAYEDVLERYKGKGWEICECHTRACVLVLTAGLCIELPAYFLNSILSLVPFLGITDVTESWV